MKLIRFLICLFTILGICQIGKADQQVGLIGNRAVIYKGPWNNLTPLAGITHYTIKNIPKSYQAIIQITNFDAGVASVTLNNLYCSIDPNLNDYDSAANKGKFTNVSFSANGVSSTAATLSLAGGSVFGSGTVITTPTLPCSSITLEFNSASQLTSTVEVVATFSDLLLNQTGIGGGIAASSSNGNVQGISAQGINAQGTFPIVDGALLPAVNASVLAIGVDNFGTTLTPFTAQISGTFLIGTPPSPSSPTDYGLMFFDGFQGIGGTGLVLGSGWTCLPGLSCGAGSSLISAVQMNNVTTSAKPFVNLINTTVNQNGMANFLLFNRGATHRQNNAGTGSNIMASNTLAGSTIVVAYQCNASPCVVDSVSDTQGNSYRQVQTLAPAGCTVFCGLNTWVAGPTIAAADTITAVPHAGTSISNSAAVELSGVTPANLNQPLSAMIADSNKLLGTGGNFPGITDPCQTPGVLKQSVVINITSATDTALVAPVTGAFVYSCGFSVTVVGGTFQLEYGTGATCLTGITPLTGAYPIGSVTYGGAGESVLKATVVSNGVCARTGAGVTNAQGVYTYVQQ